jgi:hypothetical protein
LTGDIPVIGMGRPQAACQQGDSAKRRLEGHSGLIQ